jgi:stalled ribosome rescue protein Dom34
MNRTVVLLDTQHAKIFHIGDATTLEKLRQAEPNHHTHRKSNDEKEGHHFFGEVAGHLVGSDEILVIGHGVAKTHFKTWLEEHQKPVAKKVVGYETVDHPTDGQIAAMAEQYFPRVESTHRETGRS